MVSFPDKDRIRHSILEAREKEENRKVMSLRKREVGPHTDPWEDGDWPEENRRTESYQYPEGYWSDSNSSNSSVRSKRTGRIVMSDFNSQVNSYISDNCNFSVICGTVDEVSKRGTSSNGTPYQMFTVSVERTKGEETFTSKVRMAAFGDGHPGLNSGDKVRTLCFTTRKKVDDKWFDNINAQVVEVTEGAPF